MKYAQPTIAQIDAEVARLQARYEAFMRANGAEPCAEQLREWAAENLREQIILETDAKRKKVSVDALLKTIAAEAPRATIAEARAIYKANPEHFRLPERVHARHIVIHRGQIAASEAMTTLLNLRVALQSGAITWEDAVRQTSSCPEQSDLGFFPKGAMVEPFEAAAFAAEEDTITDVVETQLGWHLIHVIAHLPEEQALFEEVRDRILDELQTTKDREAIEAYLDSRKQYFA